MGKKLLFSLLIILLLFVIPVYSKQTIEENQIRITSEDNYYCEPIFKGDSCLIRADFLIENIGSGNKNVFVDASFTDSFIDVEGYKNKKTKEKYDVIGTKTKDKLKIDGYQNISLTLEFWVEINGKFNIIVDNSGTLTILDPYYNVTTNAFTPSYHLINGTINVYSDNEFTQKIDVSSGLFDGNDSTTYETLRTYLEIIYQNYTDGNWEGTESLAGSLEILAVNYTIELDKVVHNITACYHAVRENISVFANVTIGNSFTGINIPLPQDLDDTPDYYTCVDIPKSYLNDGENLIGIGCSGTCSSPKNRLFISVDTTTPIQNSYYWDTSTWTVYTDRDYGIYIKYKNETNVGKAISVFFNYTFNTINDYWLRTRKTISGLANVTIHTYLNSTHINLTNKKSYVITTDWDVIPINNLLYDGYNLPFRIYTNKPFDFSEIQLIEQILDNTSPTINNCEIINTNLTCGDTLQMRCNVTDNRELDKVYFQWVEPNGTFYQEADKLLDTNIFWINKTINCECNTTTEYLFEFVNATDFLHNEKFLTINLSYYYICYTCVEDWQINYYSCLNNDSYFLTYYDDSSCGTIDDLPVDNRTWKYCDYCTPNPINTSCVYNGIGGVLIQYDYYNCYGLTNLSSDIYVNSSFACFPLINELEVVNPTLNPKFTTYLDKINWIVRLPTNEDYNCWTYINDLDGMTIQVNPQQTSGFLNRNIEDREYFKGYNGLANVHFYGKSMIIDDINEYIWGVKCSSDNTTLTSEYYVIPHHKNVYVGVSLGLWFKDNFIMFILLILSLWLTFIFIMWLIKKAKGD